MARDLVSRWLTELQPTIRPKLSWHRANGMTWFVVAFAEMSTLARSASEEKQRGNGNPSLALRASLATDN